MLPESLRRVWDDLDDDERARLNLIIMNYFDPYQPRADSQIEESDQLEAIVDDFMVERMGGKGAFIHNYKIDPAELGQVEHDKKYFSPAGEHQYIRYNDILYHPDDRKDLEMKYASADTAFDTAFNLIKFDFHFAPNASTQGHHYAADHNKTRPSEYTQNKEYDRKPRMKGVGQQNAAHYPKGSREWVDLSTAIDKPAIPPSTQSDKGTYHRGESTPRLNDDGSYTGINLSALDFTDDEKWDENVEEMGAIGAHETVHRVQNDDITEWAKEQTGYKEPPEGEEFDFDRWVAGPTEEEKQQKNNYKTLRSIGHEFGAYSATPDSSQPSGFMSPEKRKQMMSGPIYRGREYSMGDKPFSDLRQKSESMTAFNTAWNLCKNELCGDERRIIMEGKSAIGRCIRPKGHPRYGLDQNGNPLNRMQMALGGHVYELVEGIELSNDDIFPKWGGGEPDPPKELRGME